MHRFKPRHFPALDGLRGLAILLVIIHHQLIPASLKGGFLGVDLFFALSGFLITTLLLMEFDATETISLRKFYARRALRLAPALVLYLAFSLAVTYRLNPAEFGRALKLAGMSLVYLTNWRMAYGWDSSFDPTSIIWSLSIEEQFYLVWPLVLFACLKIKLHRFHITAGLVGVILLVMAHRHHLFSEGAALHRLYYGTDTRADAPLMGCLLALIPTGGIPARAQNALRLLTLPVACVFAYLVITVDFSGQFLYRGGYTLIALLAAVLTWSAANDSLGLLALILEWHPLRWFGKISYSLYLWHWLLLKTTSFYYLFGDKDPWARCVFAIGIAALSYYLVEARFNKLKKRFAYNVPSTRSSETIDERLTSSGPTLAGGFSQPQLLQQTGIE